LAVWALCLPLCPPAAAEDSVDDETCLGCHADADLKPETARGEKLRLHVPENALTGSVHEDLSCTDCHVGAEDWEAAPHAKDMPLPINCGECHEKALAQYKTQCVHGKARLAGDLAAPDCHQCHGNHQIKPLASEESALSPQNQPETCGQCHGSDELALEHGIAKRRLIERYKSSVHWRSVQQGKPAASCSDCHGTHCVLPSSDEKSNVSRLGMLQACGKCHEAIVQVYTKGSHGRTLLHGNLDVPTCITCHGDHDMTSLKTQAGGTRAYAGTQICIWCHGNQRMMARYALDTSPVDSYMRDFHGLTQRGTGGTSATCADCHDPHHSLPSSHPESRMHLSNRGTTCGKCHGKTSETFIMSFTHRTKAVDQGGPIKNIVEWIYIILILVVIGGMLLHNAIIWQHAFRRKRRYQEAHGTVERLNRFERTWHWLLLSSFGLLVFTGFALKFPNSFVFHWLYSLGFSEAVRAWLHRAAAVIIIATTAMFFGYQLFTRHGRRWIGPMLPRWRDVREAFGTMAYYLGRRPHKPRYAQFNYAEKAEYWALIWGTAIMVVTGLVLWFPKSLPEALPNWLIEVARTIHFWEAVLASLAILVWHMFHTMFHPAEYPMDTSWLTGVLTEEEAHHRFDDAAIEAQRPQKADPDPEPPPRLEWDQDEEPPAENATNKGEGQNDPQA